MMTRLGVTRDTPSAAVCPIFCPFFGCAHTYNLWANGALRLGRSYESFEVWFVLCRAWMWGIGVDFGLGVSSLT